MKYRPPSPQEGFGWLVEDCINLYKNRKQKTNQPMRTTFGFVDVVKIVGITLMAVAMLFGGLYLLFV